MGLTMVKNLQLMRLALVSQTVQATMFQRSLMIYRKNCIVDDVETVMMVTWNLREITRLNHACDREVGSVSCHFYFVFI